MRRPTLLCIVMTGWVSSGCEPQQPAKPKPDPAQVAMAEELYEAAKVGDYLDAANLIKKGADVNLENESGNIPLHAASWYRHVDVAELLLDNGSKADHGNKAGRTPLHVATINDSAEIARMLIDRGADINKADDAGQTAAEFAAMYGSTELMTLYLEAGANPNYANDNGVSLLMRAAWNANDAAVEVLLEHGANASDRDNGRRTAWDYAKQREGNDNVIALLNKRVGGR